MVGMSSTQYAAAQRFIKFVNASPTPYHAVRNAVIRLEAAGFSKLQEGDDDWDAALQGGGRFYFTRNQASIVAFTVPSGFKPGNGISIVGTHTDSPNLKLRPVSKRTKYGYLQVACELYGGGLWHTWFDRDLSIAGRVVVSNPKTGTFTSKLIKIERPLLRIPDVAIHLDRTQNDKFSPNLETEFVPILGIVEDKLNAKPAAKKNEGSSTKTVQTGITHNHHPELIELIAKELEVTPDDIQDFDLSLYDTQPSTLGGLNDEFIFSPRLDNLMSTFCAVEAMCESVGQNLSQVEASRAGQVNVIACFNHEEIGSVSTTGAESSIIPQLLGRLAPTPSLLASSVAKSFLISADMGHAIHPNFPSKHQEAHAPMMNGGVVIKTNAKQRYATDALGTFIVRKLIEKRGRPVQEYEVRNDMACGSTIGPFLSKIGIRTVDVGAPMLSMHSIRETGGSADIDAYIDLFSEFFQGFSQLDSSLKLD
ncbi:aspartyl aminopeptidase, partial [Clavulina sp. PMI_390]